MGSCQLCKRQSGKISPFLGLCYNCIKGRAHEALVLTKEAHARARKPFGLPPEPPKTPGGLPCKVCANECVIGEGQVGFCGLRANVGGRLKGVSAQRGRLSWYHDPLPTNCVADWVCPGGTGAGYPRYALRDGPEYGCANLAVFFHACSMDCLYCQNWHFRRLSLGGEEHSAEELAASLRDNTTCICYFGGDPSPQMPFALRASRLALACSPRRPLRICFETNGTVHPGLLQQAVRLALDTGGIVKFDLKAWDRTLHRALTGVDNQRVLENFRLAAGHISQRPEVPLVVASTLMVPGYVEAQEVEAIASFIASVEPEIPYALLAFSPQFMMQELPLLSRREAQECLQAARRAGLRNVRLGNVHLLR